LRFIGCALAWRPGEAEEKPSCLVVLDERGSIIANSFAQDAGELARAAEGYTAERRGVMMGVDAPLAVPNDRGTRGIERILSKVALPAYSASRKLFGGEPYSEKFLEELEEVGIQYTDYPFPRNRKQWVVTEVDSSATLKVLSLERGSGKSEDPAEVLRSMPEPKLRKGNKEARAAAIKSAVDILWNTPGLRLRTGNLSADLSLSENVDLSKLEVNASLSHADFDKLVCLIDATLAAYTVHRHWKGRDGSMVVGTGNEGSVLLPANETLHTRIAEECRASKVPYV